MTRLWLSTALALVACALLPAAASADTGTPLVPAANVRHAAAPVKARPPFRVMNPAAYADAKREAQARATLAAPIGQLKFAPVTPRAVISGSLNQPGLAAGDNAARNLGTPPDPTGAVGPNHYVEFVNSVVRVYAKDLTTVADTAQLDTFVGATNDAVFDPQIQYDPVADRWFYVADDCTSADCSTTNNLAVGWSKTSDPSDLVNGWCRFSIRTDNRGGSGLFDDYPKLGHNDGHLIIGTNVFGSNGSFVSSRIWTVPKPPAGAITDCGASPGTAHYFTGPAASPVKDATNLNTSGSKLRLPDGGQAFTPVPANTQDSSANGYVVAADGISPFTQIGVWHVSGVPGSETLTSDSSVTVTTFATPANVPQPGKTDVLDSSDTRLTQAVAHADPDAAGAEAIWTQHTVNGPGNRSVLRWYEIVPGNTSPRQQGSISNGASFVFNGAISPTMAGNEAVAQYNVGGTAQRAQIRASSRLSGDTLGSMTGEVLLGTSAAADQDFSCPSADPTAPSCRWGDYAGATPDPSTTHRVWGTNQLIDTPSGDNPRWTTRNFALLPADGPVASLTVTPSPAFTSKTVTFDASGSTAPGGTIDKYEWDLDGNGTFETDTGTTDHTTMTYSSPQTINVGLRVTAGGVSDTTTRSLTVLSNRPTASFTVTPSTAIRGVTNVQFDGSASTDTEVAGGIASYHWDFGDGTPVATTTDATTSHVYGAVGAFTAHLTVTDSDDDATSDDVTRTVTVKEPNRAPVANPDGPFQLTCCAPFNGPSVLTNDTDADLDSLTAVKLTDPSHGTVSLAPGGTFTYTPASGFSGADSFTYAASDGQAQSGPATVSFSVAAPTGGGGTAPTPTLTASTPTSTGTTGVIALRLGLTFPSHARLAAVLKNGLSGRARCRTSCTIKLTLKIPRSLARKLHVRTTIGTARVRITGTGAKRVRIRFTRSARKHLGSVKRIVVTLSGSASDGVAGHSSRTSKKITIRR